MAWTGMVRPSEVWLGKALKIKKGNPNMQNMVYKWGGYSYPVKAGVVAAECEKIASEKGYVTSAAMVEAARADDSPLHSLFEWNDTVAGEKWRQQQAKTIIHNLKVVVEDPKTQTVLNVRAYLNTNPSQDGRSGAVYFNIKTAMENEELKAGLILRAKRELDAFAEKYRQLGELSKVIETIDAFLAEDE